MFYRLGQAGELDVELLVKLGKLPPTALEEERIGALVRLGSLPDDALEVVAYGNSDADYGGVAQAEIERRRALR